MVIYIAGKYSGADWAETDANVQRAMEVGLAVLQKGHTPFVPHLSHFLDMKARSKGISISYEEWMTHCFNWLDGCDALLYLESSPGADRELGRAREIGMEVYERVDDIPCTVSGEER